MSAKQTPIECPWAGKYDSTAVWPTGLAFPREIINGEVRFNFETRGPWSILTKLEGLAVEKSDAGVRVHGWRSLQRPRESGCAHEGAVSVAGETRRAFTSSQLFLVDGKLVSVAILYVCKKKE